MIIEDGNIKVIISGGGTGGHVFPAIAIARALERADERIEILFVGAKGRLEMEKVPAAGFKIEGLTVTGIQRKMTASNLLVPIKAFSSLFKSAGLIRSFCPDVVVGVGGYASGPMLLAAQMRGLPNLIQEQNSYAGLTNKWLSMGTSKICVAYDGMDKYFPAEKIVKTGNPVREDILDLKGKREEAYKFFNLDPSRPVLLVVGGSLGARTINESIEEGIETIKSEGVQLIWQTGKSFYERARIFESRTIQVVDFIDRMDLAYAISDSVVSRAGALAISELCVVGKPSILVPSPHVAEDHQSKNALAIVSQRACLVVNDDLARRKLVETAMMLIKNDNLKRELAENISKLAVRDAADRIAEEIIRLALD